ncbi:MAG: 3-dehydroquinate synthase [Clostridia bacterium]|nr:3-dehydroquinate synthase [Clostridia bacterium]
MQTIRVFASKEYDVLVGENSLEKLVSHECGARAFSRVCVVTDEHVAPLHLKRLLDLLDAARVPFETIVLPFSEETKSLEMLGFVQRFLAEHSFTRSDALIALGGGVIGDLTALCAALYLRGISCIQIPTTLLSMVDSSVGGKCAVNLPTGKNLVGTFFQPSLVLCDTAFLSTLPKEEFANGMAEVIKYALGFDRNLFEQLEDGIEDKLETVIATCISIKRDVVGRDEFDCGERKALNLGHTPAHAIEALSDFSIPHGAAVAMGLSVMSHAYLSEEEAARVDALLLRYGLETRVPYLADELARAALSDKKREDQNLTLIAPEGIGGYVFRKTPVFQLTEIFSRGLK